MLSIISHIFGTLIFIATILLCFVIARSAAAYNKSNKKDDQKFWSRESEANSVRKKDISNLDYIRIPVESLPMDVLSRTATDNVCQRLYDLADKKILNLSSYTNTDLKMMYGPANLDELSLCDEHFTELIRLLHHAGEILSGTNHRTPYAETLTSEAAASETFKQSIEFLEYAVSIGSDMSNTFELLGNLYKATNDRKAFDALCEQADKIESISKPVIINKLNTIKNNWK